MRRSISCSSTVCSGTESGDSGVSTFNHESLYVSPSWTPAREASAKPAGGSRVGQVSPAQCSSSDVVAGLKQAVLPCGTFDTYHQLTGSKQAGAKLGQLPQLSGQISSTSSQLLRDIQAQNQAAIAQVRLTLHGHTRYWPIQRPKQASPSQHWNCLEESNADVAVDVECCGDSGAASKICSVAPCNSALFSSSSAQSVSVPAHSPFTFQPNLPKACPSVRTTPNATLSVAYPSQDGIDSGNMPMALTPRMPHAGSALSEPQASTELLFRMNHARQTVEFVHRQVTAARHLVRGTFSIWEALDELSTVKELGCCHDAVPNLAQQALQTAEMCRLAHPQQDWLHLVALIHELGKLLAHPSFGPQPVWAIFSESFPVGCAFHYNITCSQFFRSNPDRRRRLYNTPTGMYQPGCGLSDVHMSWTAYEYLHQVLLLNRTSLPATAQFVLRYCNFQSLTMPGQAYDELLSEADVAMLPWLYRFQSLQHLSKQPGKWTESAVQLHTVKAYYDTLIAKYIPGIKLQF